MIEHGQGPHPIEAAPVPTVGHRGRSHIHPMLFRLELKGFRYERFR
jgi:hypothetical protein